MELTQRFDVIVVGSGAGGAAAAYALVRRGLQVLLIERGSVLPRDGSTLRVDPVLREGRFRHPEVWQSADGEPFQPTEFNNFGGKTKWYGAALLRFAPHEFASEPGFAAQGFPLRYEELAPFYDQAEQLLEVRHFDTEPELERMLAGFSQRGWQRQALPMGLRPAILQHPEEARRFDGFASPSDLKLDAQVAFLNRLTEAPNLAVLVDAEVTGLEPHPEQPRCVGAVTLRDGRRLCARAVVLAAGALHSPRLLTRYLQQTGLEATLPAARQVGRNYKCHFNTAYVVFAATPRQDLLRKTTLLLHPDFPHSSVQTLGWMDGELVALEAPGWLPRGLVNLLGARAYGFWLTTEDPSHPDNRVLATEPPTLDYDPHRTPGAWAEHRKLIGAVRGALMVQGLLGSAKTMPLGATAHACGTLSAGADPTRAVVGADGRVHGLHNLYVADGSVLTRASRVNPALTIYAWGLRVGSHLEPSTQPC